MTQYFLHLSIYRLFSLSWHLNSLEIQILAVVPWDISKTDLWIVWTDSCCFLSSCPSSWVAPMSRYCSNNNFGQFFCQILSYRSTLSLTTRQFFIRLSLAWMSPITRTASGKSIATSCAITAANVSHQVVTKLLSTSSLSFYFWCVFSWIHINNVIVINS